MMMATLGFLKVMAFLSKAYGVIIYAHDVKNKIVPGESNYIVDVVMLPKFCRSSISMRKKLS